MAIKWFVVVLLLVAYTGQSLAQPYAVVTEKDTSNYSFAILDGDNVSMYADLSILRKTSKYDHSYTADIANELWNIEKNFRGFNNMWMAQLQLSKITKALPKPQNRLDVKIFSRALNDLGIIYHHLGQYKKSEEYTFGALNWRNSILGKYNMATICSFNNLGALYRDMGKYEDALKKLNEAEALLKAKNLTATMEYAIVQNNQAMLYIALANYEKAQQLLDAAISTADKFTADKSKDFLAFLGNKALLLHAQKKYDEAEKTFLSIKEIKEGRLGKKSPQYARTLNNLASLYLEMGKLDQVELLLNTALEIYKKEFGENHPVTTSIMSNLGKYYWFSGNLSQAEVILLQAQKVQNYILGKFHPDIMSTTSVLALTYWEAGKIHEAKVQFDKVKDALMMQVVKYFPALNEQEKNIFWTEARPYLMKYYSFVVANHKEYPALLSDMYSVHLATKGLLLSISTKVKQQILNSGDSLIINKYQEWLALKNDLAYYYSLPRTAVIQLGVNVLSVEAKANKMETELGNASPKFVQAYNAPLITVNQLQEQLQESEVTVEVIRYDAFEKKSPDEPRYALLVVKKNSLQPELVSLTNGSELEKKYFKQYRNAVKFKMKDELSYTQYWAKLAEATKGIKRLYLSVDGVFNQINVNTLQNNDGHYVIDDIELVVLASTRDLLNKKMEVRKNTTAMLMGYPFYGEKSSLEVLPGTKVEVELVTTILKKNGFEPTTLLQKDAGETQLKKVSDPDILHIATHGFFTADIQTNSEANVLGFELKRAYENPLLRSGLMLAFSEKLVTKNFSLNEDDGVLTAYEAMNLSLNNTELVVLSACETGLGEVQAGEGVYGLQRAFQIAGSGAVIISLWKVDDTSTQLLMTNFYSEWVKSGDLSGAFIHAQKKIREKFPDPYYWGAFVLLEN